MQILGTRHYCINSYRTGRPSARALASRHHLHRLREILGTRLNTIHNLDYHQALTRDIRAAIGTEKFEGFAVRLRLTRAG